MQTPLWSYDLDRSMTVEEARLCFGPSVRHYDGSSYDERKTGVEIVFRCAGCGSHNSSYPEARECLRKHQGGVNVNHV